jgi:Ca-activated chloride channel family protein
MRFASEFWLYLIPLLPLLWLGLRAADRRAAERLALLLGPHAQRQVEGANPRLRSWRRFLSFSGAFWLMLALAQPQWGAQEVSVTQRGSDIVVALDISNSMLAEDVPPNRMESAKGELNNFLGRLENSRVGLVFFAGSAFVQCPLTLDYGTAEIFLRMAGPDMMSEQGTAIGAALEASRQLLAKGRDAEARGSFQAILLVTDGEDLEGSWEQQAEACAKEGIKVIPVGVGEETGGLIPVEDQQGRAAGFMKDDDGSLVMSRLDLASLEKIAGMSGGSTFRIGVDGLAGDRLFAELQRLGRRDLEERRISSYQDRYIWPLALGLLCFVLELLIHGKTSPVGGHRPMGTSAGRRVTAVGLVLLLGTLAVSSSAWAGVRPPGAAEAEQGRSLYLAGNYEDALALFQEALVLAPEDPKISLAIGETLFKLERYEEAKAEFERALHQSEDQNLKAEALYNSGTADLAAGDPQQAASQLLESLKMVPDSPDALHNLEVALLRQQQQQQQQQQQENQEEQDKEKKEEEQKDQQDQQDQKDQEQQDKQDQQQQQDQQEQQDPQEQDPQEQDQQEQQEQDQQQQQEQESQPQDQELTKEQAMQILKALDRDEEELKRSVQKRLKGGRPKSGKRW